MLKIGYLACMQTQAPRQVLAEAAMDTLFLSYADPELAAEVILGHFESAPHPNLPCMREDGSYNMVADDGQVCGTAPEWGFPLWCCDQLLRRIGDLGWLRRLYPRAAAYVRWWLDHRRDTEGWMVYACSWESGQDVSSRFGPQQTGGSIIQHVRPVDLQASVALSAEILARWATILADNAGTADTAGLSGQTGERSSEAAWWRTVAGAFGEKTRAMWRDGWFRDYDSRVREWSTQQDAMHLAPVFCGVVEGQHIEQLRPFLAKPPMHSSGWAPLSWPPVVMTLVGATAAAHMPLDAAELAYRFIDGSYRSSDRRELDEQGGLPGVTREYRRTITAGKWGEIDYVNAGIDELWRCHMARRVSSMGDLDIASLFFSLPDGIFISSVRPTTTELVVRIACQRSCAACPLCQQTSERVHGNYGRTVADLPCAGRRVILSLTVRKFVCSAPTCPRQIFTERLPDLVQSSARMTNRLREALVALGLATSAEVSERLAPKLGMLVSAPTLLSRLRAVSCPPPKSVRILGVDDWGATRSRRCSCKDSRKEALTWGSAPKCPTRLNQVRLGQRSRVREDGLEPAR